MIKIHYPKLLTCPTFPSDDASLLLGLNKERDKSPSAQIPKVTYLSNRPNLHISPNSPNHLTKNIFGPLLPNSKLNSKPILIFSSGPMLPPRFENHISSEAKKSHAQRRLRKLQKKRKRKPLLVRLSRIHLIPLVLPLKSPLHVLLTLPLN